MSLCTGTYQKTLNRNGSWSDSSNTNYTGTVPGCEQHVYWYVLENWKNLSLWWGKTLKDRHEKCIILWFCTEIDIAFTRILYYVNRTLHDLQHHNTFQIIPSLVIVTDLWTERRYLSLQTQLPACLCQQYSVIPLCLLILLFSLFPNLPLHVQCATKWDWYSCNERWSLGRQKH